MATETEIEAIVASSEPSEIDHKQLEGQALRGTSWIIIFYGLSMALRLVSSVVLTRMFSPESFGLMALLTTIIIGMSLFSHIGVQDSIIQNPRGDEVEFLNTGWTLQVIRGIFLQLLSFALGWPFAVFYHEPRMIWLLPALGFSCLVGGFSSPSLLTLARHIGVGRLSLLELISQAVQLIATIVWAYYRPSIWALVAGKLIAEVVRTIVSFYMLPHIRAHFAWEKEAVRELIHFGRWILIGTGLTFLALQSDRLILGRLVSFELLGIYGVAFTVSDIPRQIILQFCSRVGFPFIAKFAGGPRQEYGQILRRYRRYVLLAGALMIAFTVATGDLFVQRVYDHRYAGAAPLVALFAIGLWHTLLYGTTTPAVMSLQKAHYNALGYAAYCVTLFIALPLSYHAFGMIGAVLAVAFSDVPMYIISAYSAYREGIRLLHQDFWLTVCFWLIIALTLALRHAIGFGLPIPLSVA